MNNSKNVFVSSAELGVPFGIMLILASAATIYVDKIPLLNVVTIIVAILAPVILYRFQLKRFLNAGGKTSFSELWTLAIFTTIGGAMICMLVTYCMITWLRPDFLYEQMQMVVDVYKTLPQQEATEAVKILETAIKTNNLPTAFEFCMQMFWLTASLGCMGGLLTAAIAIAAGKRKIFSNKDYNNNTSNTL